MTNATPSARRRSILQWALIVSVPLASLAIAARQLYLSTYHDLSTWKGGGMGMFAGADGGINRYAKIFVVDPVRGQHPITRFTPEQTTLLDRALNYPTRENFLLVAQEIATMDWVAGSKRMPVGLVNAKAENIGKTGDSHFMMIPFGPRPANERWEWEIAIEYWQISYEPETRSARTALKQSFRFGPDELGRGRQAAK